MKRNHLHLVRAALVALFSGITLSGISVAQVPAHATPIFGSMKKFFDHASENSR